MNIEQQYAILQKEIKEEYFRAAGTSPSKIDGGGNQIPDSPNTGYGDTTLQMVNIRPMVQEEVGVIDTVEPTIAELADPVVKPAGVGIVTTRPMERPTTTRPIGEATTISQVVPEPIQLETDLIQQITEPAKQDPTTTINIYSDEGITTASIDEGGEISVDEAIFGTGSGGGSIGGGGGMPSGDGGKGAVAPPQRTILPLLVIGAGVALFILKPFK